MNSPMQNGAAAPHPQQPPQGQPAQGQSAPGHPNAGTGYGYAPGSYAPQGQPPGQPQAQPAPGPGAPPPMSYQPEGAAKADMGGRIDRTASYIGAFTKVKYHTYPSGAAGYIFDFKSTQGQEARSMFICTRNKAGEPVEMGENKVAAILCCMGVSNAQPVQATIKEMNWQLNQDQEVNVWLYPEAMHKPIGVVLQKELYTNQNTGRDAFRMALVLAFQASSQRTAKEMIDNEPATAVATTLEGLGDHDTRSSIAYPNHTSNTGVAPRTANHNGQTVVDFDEDIPF